jgi:competence protein ComEA
MQRFCRVLTIVALAVVVNLSATSPTLAIAASSAQSTLLDLNTATPAQLKSLPGMGDAYVHRVIEGRPYTAKNQLATRGVLPQPAYDKISSLIIAKRPAK